MYTALFQERKVRTNFIEPFPKQNKTKKYNFFCIILHLQGLQNKTKCKLVNVRCYDERILLIC